MVRIQKGYRKEEIVERRHKRLVKASKVKRAEARGVRKSIQGGEKSTCWGLEVMGSMVFSRAQSSWGDKSLRKRVLR